MSSVRPSHRGARHGQAIPAGRMEAPATLGPRGTRIWEDIQRSFPNVYTWSDAPMLLGYCVLAAEVEAYFSGETTMPALDFDRKLKQQLALGRSLRLSPQSRAAQDTNISMPFGNAMMENTEGGSPEAPWVSK